MGTPAYIHLTAKSSFSLLEGMVPVKKLAKAAASRQLAALGVCEIGNIFSAVEVSKHLGGAGVQPILGCEVPVWLPQELGKPRQAGYLPLLVQDEEGWKNLARLISRANMSKYEDGQCGADLDQVLAANAGLIALTGNLERGLLATWRKAGDAGQLVERLQGAYGDRLYGQIERHGLPFEPEMESFVAALGLPLAATNDSRFLEPDDLPAFEALVAIGDSTTLDDPNRRRFTPNHALRDEAEMVAAFKDRPDALANTVEIAQRCAYLLAAVPVKKMFMPRWEFSPGRAVPDVLREEAEAGLAKRLEDFVYPLCDGDDAKAAAKEKYRAQLAYELEMIIKMGFEGYFLITSDFIRWAKGQGIPVGPGRGSGAGSLVAWALQITNLDPIRWELYFERFLNPDRVSLPDFDIDFCQDRREEVIAYVRKRFGAERVCHIITFGTLKARACLRDVGRVLGLPYSFVGQIAAFIPEVPNPPPIKDVLEADERLKARYHEEEDVQRLVDTAMQLEGCYRHASTHAAGVIISDRPVDEVCGLYVDPRTQMPVTQLAMGDAEYTGLVKFDFLGLKTLSVIRMAEDMVKLSHDPAFDIDKVPLDDQATYDMLKTGATCGVFQVEGGGITDVTKKMQAEDLEGLSAILALYRPGPMDLIPQYLAVRHGQQQAEYAHPLLESVLGVTFGIAVYQEQVMQMARVLAGYTLGGADMLRRAMGKKKPEEMAKERSKFVAGAAALHNIPEEQANQIFDLMEVFAGYGFNKAHSIAYALISYQTAWLKAHYPREFMAATMTYDRGNTDKLLRYKQELGQMGLALRTVDVNLSGVFFTVEEGGVRHALSALKGAGEEAMRQLVAEREKGGAYKDIWDLLARNEPQNVSKRQLEVLTKSGALDSLAGGDKHFRARVLANLEQHMAYAVACADQRTSGQNNLFGGGDDGRLDPAPFMAAMQPPLELDYLGKLAFEQEAVGFYLSAHPMEAYGEELKRIVALKPLNEIEEFAQLGGGSCRVAGLMLGVREVKTQGKDGTPGRMGIVTLSDPSGQAEVVIFPRTYAEVGPHLHAGVPLVFWVKVSLEGERLRISADTVSKLEDAMGVRAEIHLEVRDPVMLPRIQRVLADNRGGPTKIRLSVPGREGQVVMRLPDGYRLDTRVLGNLRGMDGVVVH